MSFISVDVDNSLVIHDAYDDRVAVADVGGRWDAEAGVWRVAFTTENLNLLLDKLNSPSVSQDMEAKLLEQQEREARLERLRSLSKTDAPVNLRVAGLRASLYNYQRIGVMYSMANGTGVLLADEMGLGKTIQCMATALMLKAQGKAKNALIVTPASLKFNWPLEIEKFTDEKYVVIDGTPEERIAQWLRTDVFFYVVNTELLLEDLFGGREFKAKKKETVEQKVRRETLTRKAGIRRKVLSGVRGRMWDFLAVDECFPYNTMVETDKGMLPIGYIVENQLSVSVLSCDFSTNESLYRRVVKWIGKPIVGQLVEVKHERGSFVCTGNHKIWTQEFGYIRADRLCGEESLWFLPKGVCAKKECSSVLREKLPSESVVEKISQIGKDNGRKNSLGKKGKVSGSCRVFGVQKRVFGGKKRKVYGNLLQQGLCEQMSFIRPACYSKDSFQDTNANGENSLQTMRIGDISKDDKGKGKAVLFKEMCGGLEGEKRRWIYRGSYDSDAEGGCCCQQGKTQSAGIGEDEGKKSGCRIPKEGVRWGGIMEKDSSVVSGSGRQAFHNKASENVGGGVGIGVGNGIQGVRQGEICGSDKKSSGVLSDRYCKSKIADCSGGGWEDSQDDEMENHRREEGEGFVPSRVESVEILERAGFERLGLYSKEDTRVYNLEVEADVEENHCYVADGVLVSNCHSLKHHAAKRTRNVKELRSKFRMGLTGTPMDGRLEELHSIMGFVAPGLLSSKTRFFQRHVNTDIWGRVTGYKRVAEVSRKIQPFFLRRLKKDVLADLPDKIYENRFVVLTPEESRIYKQLADHGHEATEDAQAIVSIIRCKQFCNWPSMVDDGCAAASKMEAFKEVIDEVVVQNGHKALVFSQYREMLDVLVGVLDGMGIKYLRIDGGTQKHVRADMQRTFNEDRSIDMMIGTEAMSTGLNFTAADFVVNYDDNWSPAVMDQRSDRCHRIGQRNVVTVVNFICKDTIEERIRSVLYHKSKITSQVLGDELDELVLQRLGPQEMAKLL